MLADLAVFILVNLKNWFKVYLITQYFLRHTFATTCVQYVRPDIVDTWRGIVRNGLLDEFTPISLISSWRVKWIWCSLNFKKITKKLFEESTRRAFAIKGKNIEMWTPKWTPKIGVNGKKWLKLSNMQKNRAFIRSFRINTRFWCGRKERKRRNSEERASRNWRHTTIRKKPWKSRLFYYWTPTWTPKIFLTYKLKTKHPSLPSRGSLLI